MISEETTKKADTTLKELIINDGFLTEQQQSILMALFDKIEAAQEIFENACSCSRIQKLASTYFEECGFPVYPGICEIIPIWEDK